MFCAKCGGLMVPKKHDKKKILVCASCGAKESDISKAKIRERVKEEEKELEVVTDDQEDETLPLSEADCPKCGHNKAYYWLVQTRAGDEPETKFLKCEKCKHIWRDYG